MTLLDVTTGVKPKVLELLGGNPALSYSTVANEVGVTRERVRQIAHQNGYPSRQGIVKTKVCPVCGGTFYNRKSTHCSPACGYVGKQKIIILSCYQCGKPIERKPSTMRNGSGRYYCDRVCYERRRRKAVPLAKSFPKGTSISPDM